jgi:hypothetical protein
MDKQFKLTIPIHKAYMDEDGNMYVEGLGGDTKADYDPKINPLTGRPFGYERLSISCINDMKKQIESGKIILLPRHWDVAPQGSKNVIHGIDGEQKAEWDLSLGTAVSSRITSSGQIFPKFRLKKINPKAIQLYREITEEGTKLGLSVGYGIPAGGYHVEIDSLGREIRVIDKLILWHFVVTTMPVNSRSLNNPLEAVVKSLDWGTAARVETSTFDLEEYPDRLEVEEIYKSLSGNCDNEPTEEMCSEAEPCTKSETCLKAEECTKSKGCAEEKSNAQEDGMLSEEDKKAIAQMLAEGMKSLDAQKEVEQQEAFKAKAEEKKIVDLITSTVTSTLPGAVTAAVEEAMKSFKAPEIKLGDDQLAELKKDIEDGITEKLNGIAKPYMEGMKSGMSADAKKPGAEKDPEIIEALKSLAAGDKALSEFPASVQVQLKELGNVAGLVMLSGIPEGVA